MATITGFLTITITTPPVGTPKLVFEPAGPFEAGKTTMVQVKVDDGAGNVAIPTTGVLVPYWTGPNQGIAVFVKAGYKLECQVPGTANGSVQLGVELR